LKNCIGSSVMRRIKPMLPTVQPFCELTNQIPFNS